MHAIVNALKLARCAALATLRLRESRPDDARRAAARACELDDAGGCAVFGHCLIDGLGGSSDRTAAIPAFRKACRGGDDRGCQMLAALGQPR